ncbi:Cyclin, N-terminal domain [Nesidiocoris tenuis]|uniref:Cyclin, N-terminal domain n=1 Tax=Nesidiocoris tenuis TaxID=355587 RepID=A0ABN7AER0_9HEMI|nr:Cyclin, N-terminal domain [Nesidiocoris tenuis]
MKAEPARFRRRATAQAFLSSISLDGSLRTIAGSAQKFAEEVDTFNDSLAGRTLTTKEKSLVENGRFSKNVSPTLKNNADSSFLNSSSDSHPNLLSKFFDSDSGPSNFFSLPFRERTSTIGSEYGSEKHYGSLSYRKRLLHHQLPDDKLQGIFSSSESMQSAGGSSNKKEVTFLKCLSKTQKLRGQRIVVLSQKQKIPLSVFSVIPYHKFRVDPRGCRRRNTSGPGPRPLSSINDTLDPWTMLGIEKACDGQEVSYGQFLAPSKVCRSNDVESLKSHTVVSRCYSHDSGSVHRSYPVSPPISADKGSDYTDYDANALDDPELIAGKHKRLLPFSSYTTSVILYVRSTDLKKELNDKFKEKFPHIELTLSKLRSIKREMRKIAAPDLLTTAYSYVFFERLIFKNLVNKQNRKLCAGASLILAAKLNDIKGEPLKHMIEKTESILRLNRRELLVSEFAILVALEFGLHVPTHHVLPHYHRLLSET